MCLLLSWIIFKRSWALYFSIRTESTKANGNELTARAYIITKNSRKVNIVLVQRHFLDSRKIHWALSLSLNFLLIFIMPKITISIKNRTRKTTKLKKTRTEKVEKKAENFRRDFICKVYLLIFHGNSNREVKTYLYRKKALKAKQR